jgi:sugar O-acyltransferase (sialic acid O-acetyltransferase NeuD family)
MNEAKQLIVFGASGHGKVVADIGRSIGLVAVAFLDDDPRKDGALLSGVAVLLWKRFIEERGSWRSALIGLGVGDNGNREKCVARLADVGIAAATLVHASAVVAPSAALGAGTVVMAGGVVNPDAVLGVGCIVNTGAVVEHDCRLGAFVHLSPNAALGGAVEIGDRTHLGLGAVALPGVRIGRDVVVGAGSVVHRDVPDGTTVVGVPARPIKRSS